MKKVYFTIALILTTIITLDLNAKTYEMVRAGKWNSTKAWANDYPGNEISVNDTTVIKSMLTLNTDIIVHGTLVIEGTGSLLGNREIFVSSRGSIINNGNTVTKRIVNNGAIYNNLLLETTMDLENSGVVYNNESMVIGANLLNTGGNISGNGGQFFTNKNILNQGSISGSIDLCYGNNLSNTTGKFDSIQTSICGNKLYDGLTLYADLLDNGVKLNVLNPKQDEIVSYRIERSFDGVNYMVVDLVRGDAINATRELSMSYTDELNRAQKTHYKVMTMYKSGGVKTLPVITVDYAGADQLAVAQ